MDHNLDALKKEPTPWTQREPELAAKMWEDLKAFHATLERAVRESGGKLRFTAKEMPVIECPTYDLEYALDKREEGLILHFYPSGWLKLMEGLEEDEAPKPLQFPRGFRHVVQEATKYLMGEEDYRLAWVPEAHSWLLTLPGRADPMKRQPTIENMVRILNHNLTGQ